MLQVLNMLLLVFLMDTSKAGGSERCCMPCVITVCMVGLQKSVSRCLRACLALLLFLVAFADGREREEYVQLAWASVVKLLICFILFSAANVVKTLLAKLLSSHFHKRAHFDKMQDALNKVTVWAH